MDERASRVGAPSWRLAASTLALAGGIVALAWVDHAREAAATLDDLAADQSRLAESIAGEIRAHADAQTDAARDLDGLLAPETRLERTGDLRVLLRAPGSSALRGAEGRDVSLPSLVAALDAHRPSARLSREEAAAAGLPPRMAHAGLVTIDAPPLAGLGVVVVGSAARTRDRERRGERRLLGTLLVAGAVLLGFGAFARRKQRAELLLAQKLALSEIARDRDERLARAARVATMGTLATGIAHEIATPLAVIAGRAEQLRQRISGDEKALSYVATIARETADISEVIRRFLGLARDGKPELAAIKPAELLSSSARMVEHRFERAGVSLSVEAARDLPDFAGDMRLLEHALVNLLLNACHACQPGGRVVLFARIAGAHLELEVRDDGEGMTEEQRARALEPFFTTKPAGSGTGLGLAITSEIAKSHRGSLTLRAGSPGTVACLVLPLDQEAIAHVDT